MSDTNKDLRTAGTEPVATGDRRQAPRHDVAPEVSQALRIEVEQTLRPLGVRNVSIGGINLILGHRVEPGAIVTVRLYNRERKFWLKEPLRIVHVTEEEEGVYVVGGAFTRPISDDEIRRLL